MNVLSHHFKCTDFLLSTYKYILFGTLVNSIFEVQHTLQYDPDFATSKVWDAFGQGLSCFWAKSDFNAQTLPAESAAQCGIGHNVWARSVRKKQTSPKISADLAQQGMQIN